MATRKEHRAEFNGGQRLANKYFGKNENGKSLTQSIKTGFLRAITLGQDPNARHIDKGNVISMMAMQPMVVFAATLLFQPNTTANFDANVTHDHVLHQDISEIGGVQAYYLPSNDRVGQANKYMLVNTGDGYELYVSNTAEEINPDADNRFTLITDQVDAARIAAEMIVRYSDVDLSASPLWSATSPAIVDSDAPQRLIYEGISEAYLEDSDTLTDMFHTTYIVSPIHRVADEFQSVTSSTALDIHAWNSAYEQFLSWDDDVDVSSGGIQEVNHFEDIDDRLKEAGKDLLSIYVGLIGLGLVGGAASGINGSRKRFNNELKPKALKKEL